MLAKAVASASASAAKVYIEDVFSTWLYTGNGSTQTITNGIDLSGKGGLVWIKGRSGATGHRFTDTARGATKSLESNSTAAETTESTGLTSFSSTGFSIGADTDYSTNAATYASWTFRKQAKFFDVVTFTGAPGANTVNHSLGTTPGTIIVKCTSAIESWYVWHRSIPNNCLALNLTNSTGAFAAQYVFGNGTSVVQPTSTQFTAYNAYSTSQTFVAYLFAHDAGGFGDSGNDSVVKCGSFTNNGSGSATVDLGWEPQWLLVKRTDNTSNWWIIDTQRGWGVVNRPELYANTSGAEVANADSLFQVTSTGFRTVAWDAANSTYIYIAIRRGPMKTPTDATKVFAAIKTTTDPITTNFPVDLNISHYTTDISHHWVATRLTNKQFLMTTSTGGEVNGSSYIKFDSNTQFFLGNLWASSERINWNFRRAPGFFDAVAYTGTGSARTVSHNLGVAPELMIVKKRSAADAWVVYANNDNTDYLVLNTTAATVDDNTIWNDTSPTSSVFTVGTNDDVNGNTATFIAYLFATCPGVSKVGSYTGTGTTKQIDCGFTAGARFVLIKRTDSTGDWYVWDTARGIVSGNDPYLLLNSTAAEVTSTDYIDPLNSGFEISSTAPAAINANGGTYIYLAIA